MNGRMNGRLIHRRRIIERIIIRGQLQLQTPTCLSSGDTDSPTDLPLLKDSAGEGALLTGASLAGALRNYLWEYRSGYRATAEALDSTVSLFGDNRGNDKDDGDQSPLIINDVVSQKKNPTIELRDGVKIVPETGIAQDKAKYDLELLAAGTVFPLYFELLIEDRHDRQRLLEDLAITLHGLETGDIALGMKKRRGFGQCKVTQWQVERFDLRQGADRYRWLTYAHWPETCEEEPSVEMTSQQDDIVAALSDLADSDEPLIRIKDQRSRFTLQATFSLRGALLIRSAGDNRQLSPDAVHLSSGRPTHQGPLSQKHVISGTSLAGVLRNRAIRILNTLNRSPALVEQMFGPDFSNDPSKRPEASRLLVQESVIENARSLVQNRIAIDRFTGGALDGALFNEQPIFKADGNSVELNITLRDPEDAEIGLLLLLLKDLWTGDLPIGGGSSIGRGRLQGSQATLKHHHPTKGNTEWRIQQQGDRLNISNADSLEAFVTALSGDALPDDHEQERAA